MCQSCKCDNKINVRNEKFSDLSQEDLVKMWRTLKAESGNRMTTSPYHKDEVNLKELMERMEDRTLEVNIENLKKKLFNVQNQLDKLLI